MTTSTSKSEFKNDNEESNFINDQETTAVVEPDDPCNSYEWSVLFLLMLILALTFITIEGVAMFRRRKSILM